MTSETASPSSVRHEVLHDGAVWRIVLDSPPANILDGEKITALTALFERAATEGKLKAVLIAAEGKHFCFGASVEEHLPGSCADMLAGLHKLFEVMLQAAVPTVVAVRGQCLGAGLELAAFCHRVVASPTAKFGQPEIVLGVFAPVASVVLPGRVGRGLAEDMLLSGRSLDAESARATGLADELADDPGAAALAYIEEHLLPKSASSLRLASRAARLDFQRRFVADIRELERLYLDQLMATSDANEGLNAFIEKRPPVWSDS